MKVPGKSTSGNFRIRTIAYCVIVFNSAIACIAQISNAPSHEIYRLRVQNISFGNIEISSDAGRHYALIGRVMEPATAPELDRTSRTPGTVIRSSANGIVFSMGKNEILKLVPIHQIQRSKKMINIPRPIKNVMKTNLQAGTGIFTDIAPPVGTRIQLQFENDSPRPVEEKTVINDEDALIFAVFVPISQTGDAAGVQIERESQLRKVSESISAQYASSTLSRAAASGTKIVSGKLTLKAKFVPGEPEPIIAVSYLVDNDVVYAQNTAPFEHIFDTKELKDGEHVVEIRGFDKKGNPVSHKRSLVVVRNGT